jgi:uncharacterized protein (TIGR03083 family)
MSTRALRQYYEPVIAVIPDEAVAPDAWSRHRRRFVASLSDLSEADWAAPTRCTNWDTKEVVAHLVAVDQFWIFTLGAARAGHPPTTYLRHFDPATGTDAQVASLSEARPGDVLEQFAHGTDALVALVDSLPEHDWDALGESPLGHLPARVLFAHAFWDSWLHERDIFVPLDRQPPPESDELLAVTCFSLLFAGLQGGLLGDPIATGPALSEPLDEIVQFEELPDTAVRVIYDTGARIALAAPGSARTRGSAVALVEGLAGRRALGDLEGGLAPSLVEHVARASHVL